MRIPEIYSRQKWLKVFTMPYNAHSVMCMLDDRINYAPLSDILALPNLPLSFMRVFLYVFLYGQVSFIQLQRITIL